MSSKTGNGGRRGRGRGGSGAGRRNVHRQIVASSRFTIRRAPLRQPTVNRNFTFPLTVMVSHDFTAAGNYQFKLEHFIESIMSVVSMSASWNDHITISPHSCSAYGLIPEMDKQWDPSFTFWVFDPLTNVEVKSVAAIGRPSDPPRIEWDFPLEVSAHPFKWDGVAGTSPALCGITTKDIVNIYVYLKCTVRICVMPTWSNSVVEAFESLAIPEQ